MPTYFAIRVVMLLAPRVPRRIAYSICHVLGLVLWRFNHHAARLIASSLPYTLGRKYAPKRAERVVQRTFVNLAKDYYELVAAAMTDAAAIRGWVVTEGLEHVDAARAKGRGVIAVFFHTTGFNLGLQAATIECGRTWVVAEPLRPLPMRRLVNALRSSHGVRLLAPDRAGLLTMTRALRNNEIVALAVDRGISGTGAWVHLFGQPAFLPTGAAALALRTGATILTVHTSRLPDGRICLRVGPEVPYIRTGSLEDEAQEITQGIVRRFEFELRNHPEEWVVIRDVWGAQGSPEARCEPRPLLRTCVAR